MLDVYEFRRKCFVKIKDFSFEKRKIQTKKKVHISLLYKVMIEYCKILGVFLS